jgi:hypothetical protein
MFRYLVLLKNISHKYKVFFRNRLSAHLINKATNIMYFKFKFYTLVKYNIIYILDIFTFFEYSNIVLIIF